MKFVVIAALAVGVASCSPAGSSKPAEAGPASNAGQPAAAQPPPAAVSPAADAVRKYDLKGKVVAINKAARKVQVDAGDIPGFMMAMTMAYPVKDEHLLDTLAPGDEITAKVVSAKDEYWLEDIRHAK